jgi:hypothetical protein
MSEFGACSEFVLQLREELGYWEAVTLTGFSVTYKKHTVLLIVRVIRQGEGKCVFIECEEQVECWRTLWRWIHTRKAIVWQVDKFYKK